MKRNLAWSIAAALTVMIFGYGLFVLPANNDLAQVRDDLTSTDARLATDKVTLSFNSKNDETRQQNTKLLNLQQSSVTPGLLEGGVLAELQTLEPKVRITSLTFPDATYAVVPIPQASPDATPNPRATPTPTPDPDAGIVVQQRASPTVYIRKGTIILVGHYRDLLQALATLSTGPILVQITGTVTLKPFSNHDTASDPVLTMTAPVAIYRVVPPPGPAVTASSSPSAVAVRSNP